MIQLVVITIILVVIIVHFARKSPAQPYKLPSSASQLLLEHVPFYEALDAQGRAQFEARVEDFLAHTTIRGVDTEVTLVDRLLIASGAITLIFAFPTWRYNNLDEVLLYKGAFDRDFKTDGAGRDVLGMVGDGAMHRIMLLSRPSLLASFGNPSDGYNTVLHEFAHLIDKADGATDGVPEYLLSKPHLLPWIKAMHDTIQAMKAQPSSDINLYGATNEAEFFAVITEYFFEKPAELKQHHPELFALLEEMFHPEL